MFYSQTFLARKGPLGTVWCAAHLQHRLKKSHYASTHIPNTVDQIMTPDVPLALRMSAHLLLGVVRIYSKKVDYLHYDCNLLCTSLQKMFRASHLAPNLNLPHITADAASKAVTLPPNFALDGFDHFPFFDGSSDTHILSEDEITLKDHYQSDATDGLYVTITFDDDINQEGSLNLNTETMVIDSPRVPESSIPADSLHMDPETTMVIDSPSIPDPNQANEPIEGIRDRDDIYILSPVLRPHESANFESNVLPLGKTPERDTDTPKSLHASIPQMQPRTSPHSSGPSQLELGSLEAPKMSDLELRPSPSPSPSPQRPQPQQRRRKRAFDETLVLNNMFYKKALNDASDLVKKQKKLPSSSLEMWRFGNNKNKEHFFIDPLISGMCTSLQDISSKDLTSLNPNLIVPEKVQQESRADDSPRRVSNNDETEHIRSPDPGSRQIFEQVFPSPPRSIFSDAATSTSPRIPSTQPRLMSPATDVDMTPNMSIGGANDDQTTTLADIPEWIMEPNDLLFLEQDSNSPPDSQSGSGRDTMSVRTRAVAEYLKTHSPLSKLTDGSPDDLSLNAILEGRSRKLSARMFFETLVLKDCGLIDVKQEEPYADITLKLTMSKL